MTARINSNAVMRTTTQHSMSNTILLRRTGRAEEIASTAQATDGQRCSSTMGDVPLASTAGHSQSGSAALRDVLC
jgi:hypothetical protein